MVSQPKILILGDEPARVNATACALKGLDAELAVAGGEGSGGAEADCAMVVAVAATAARAASLAEAARSGQDIPALVLADDGHQADPALQDIGDSASSTLADSALRRRVNTLLATAARRRRLAELERENRRLKEVNNQLSSFVSMVAHDLRSPLSKIINISDVLIAGVDADELEAFYQMLHATSRRAFDLVNEILDLNALEAGKIQLEMRKCDLWSLARQVIAEVNHQAKQKDIALANRIEEPIEVKADAHRLFQVLVNLIGNALKFTEAGGSVALDAVPEGALVRLEVRDNGVGMPQETVDKLFHKHEKISTTGTDGEKGTGFGLPLSQKLIQAHGSKIKVHSKKGQGSRFSFTLPRWNS